MHGDAARRRHVEGEGLPRHRPGDPQGDPPRAPPACRHQPRGGRAVRPRLGRDALPPRRRLAPPGRDAGGLRGRPCGLRPQRADGGDLPLGAAERGGPDARLGRRGRAHALGGLDRLPHPHGGHEGQAARGHLHGAQGAQPAVGGLRAVEPRGAGVGQPHAVGHQAEQAHGQRPCHRRARLRHALGRSRRGHGRHRPGGEGHGGAGLRGALVRPSLRRGLRPAARQPARAHPRAAGARDDGGEAGAGPQATPR